MLSAHGQCRLSVVSATSLKLSPHGGRNLNINGATEHIPSAGITISNGSLSASTRYFVYAAMSGGSMVLELSTTGHETAASGVEVKTGDASRTLVGMIATNASSQFANSITSPTCINWFNRRTIIGATPTVTGSTTSTASFAEITASGRIPFLAWADEAVEVQVVGAASNNTAGNINHSTSPGLDGVEFGAQTQAHSFAASINVPAVARSVTYVSEALHTASAFGKVSAGTGSWNFGVQLTTRG
jgi:hypothetical protein